MAHYPDGTTSAPFLYDEVDRRNLDATVVAAHYRSNDGRRWVFLRSSVRPPAFFRGPERAATAAHGAAPALWELPAGLVEPDELSEAGLLESARRELWEETGLAVQAAALKLLGPSTFPSAGVLGERHVFFEVEVDPRFRREPPLDGSALERHGAVVAVPLDDALRMCSRGDIQDAKTELGLRRLRERYA